MHLVYYFYFSSLKVLKHYLLATLVSTEKLAISLVALKVMRFFSFLCLLDVVLIVCILFSVPYSWICGLISLINLGKISVIISTVIALVPSLTSLLVELNYTHTKFFYHVPHVPSVVFFPLFFFFCISV